MREELIELLAKTLWEKHYPGPGYIGWGKITGISQREYLDDARAILDTLLSRLPTEEWPPIETAPKDGTYIVAEVDEISEGPLARYSGRCFVIRHAGATISDFDMGWDLYPGFGGVSDRCFKRWRNLGLPAPPPQGGENG